MKPDRRILQPGWAGDLTDAEIAYIAGKISRDRRVAAKWGIAPGTNGKTEQAIRAVSMAGATAKPADAQRKAQKPKAAPVVAPEAPMPAIGVLGPTVAPKQLTLDLQVEGRTRMPGL